MAANSKIEWTDHTFNPWMGCAKVSLGCDHCFAEARMDTRLHRVKWGAGQPRVRTKNWGDPVKWNAAHNAFYAQHGRRQRVFCASLADVFDNEAPVQWRRDLFDLIEATPQLDWLLLTKRIGNARSLYGEAYLDSARPWPENVWLGATVVNQEEAARDIPKLLAVPAAKRFLSIEPLLGRMYIEDIPDPAGGVCLKPLVGLRWVGNGRGRSEVRALSGRIDWVIVGGESGPSARPMHPDWVRGLRDQCNDAGVRFMFKQWGEWWEVDSDARDEKGNHIEIDPYSYEGREMWDPKTDALLHVDGRRFTPETLPDDTPARLMRRLGKKAAGRRLDGREWNEVPG